MATVDHHKKIPAMTICPNSLGREMQAVHPSLAVVVDVEGIQIKAGQPSRSKGAKGADVFVMVAGDKVVCEMANLHFGGQEQLIGGRRGVR